MSRVTIWQCKDECCEDRTFDQRWWLARSKDFEFYEQVSTYQTAAYLARKYLSGRKP